MRGLTGVNVSWLTPVNDRQLTMSMRERTAFGVVSSMH
jgi:hypothetical protein